MTWVPYIRPQPFSLHAFKDGRFGRYDPTLFPQLLPQDYSWYAAVRIRPKSPDDPISVMWWDVTERDFVLDSGSVFCDIGKLTPARLQRFEDLQTQLSNRVRHHHEQSGFTQLVNSEEVVLKHSMMRLRMLSCTFKDLVGQVAEFQRNYLLLLALLDYREIFEPRFTHMVDGVVKAHPPDLTRMGVITSQPAMVQYFYSAGIPVWHLRSRAAVTTSIPPIPPVSPDIHVNMDEWCACGETRPFPTIYQGSPGRHIFNMRRLGCFLSGAVDLELLPAEASEAAVVPQCGPSRPTKDHARAKPPCKTY
jgi:hypothetical protein